MLTGRQIREAREKLGWLRSDLARRAGLATSVIVRAEAAESEPVVTTAQIAALRLAFTKAGETLTPQDRQAEEDRG